MEITTSTPANNLLDAANKLMEVTQAITDPSIREDGKLSFESVPIDSYFVHNNMLYKKSSDRQAWCARTSRFAYFDTTKMVRYEGVI